MRLYQCTVIPPPGPRGNGSDSTLVWFWLSQTDSCCPVRSPTSDSVKPSVAAALPRAQARPLGTFPRLGSSGHVLAGRQMEAEVPNAEAQHPEAPHGEAPRTEQSVAPGRTRPVFAGSFGRLTVTSSFPLRVACSLGPRPCQLPRNNFHRMLLRHLGPPRQSTSHTSALLTASGFADRDTH